MPQLVIRKHRHKENRLYSFLILEKVESRLWCRMEVSEEAHVAKIGTDDASQVFISGNASPGEGARQTSSVLGDIPGELLNMRMREGETTMKAKRLILITLFLCVIGGFFPSASQAAPNRVNFQGELTDSGGSSLAGTFPMTFRVFDVPSGGTPLWEEDQMVTVTNGIYNVLLGSGATNPAYGVFDPALFSGDNRWLEVVVTGAGGSEILTPRQRITSTAYSLQSVNADTVDDKHATDLDQSAHIGRVDNPHQVTAAQAGAATPADLGAHAADSSAHHTKTSIFSELTGQIGDSQIPSTITRDTELSWSNLSGIPAGFADGVDNGITGEVDPQVGSNLTGYVPKWNGSSLSSGSIYDNGNIGVGTTSPTQKLTLGSGASEVFNYLEINSSTYGGVLFHGGGRGGQLIYNHSGNYMNFGTSPGDGSGPWERLRIDKDGNVGVGTTVPGTRLSLGGTGSTNGITLGEGQTVEAYLYHTSTATRIDGPGDRVQFGSVEYIEDCGANCTNLGLANVGIGTAAPTEKLHVAGSYIRVNGAGNEQAYIGGDGFGGDVQVGSQNAAITSVALWNTATSARMDLYLGALHVMGGSDLAEPFDIAGHKAIKPGMVVSIDPDNPGHLKVAGNAYDKTVAGIVSGAKGIRPGLTMAQEGTETEGQFPVALSGRVYAWADASYGPIEPGDLLTTSDTPGHAMKVAENRKAHGTIIGKAMTSLKDGKGLVLVLVTLQ